MDIQAFYERIGGSYRDVLTRLSSDAFIVRFLKMFRSEQSYNELMEAVEKGDIQLSFASAHKLKGVVANMAFSELHTAASALTEQLRAGTEQADPSLLCRVTECYNKIIAEIDALGL